MKLVSSHTASLPAARARRGQKRDGNSLKTLIIVVCGAGGFGLVAAMLLNQPAPDLHKKIPQITVLRLPPPPPPPKPEEKPPEPPKIKEEVKIETPHPEEPPRPADEAPPPGPLGVDAQGSGAGDAFGLAGRPGGRDITTIGSGGGSALSQNIYGNGVAHFLAQELGRDPKLKNAAYTVEVLVWMSRDGRVIRNEIVKGSGNDDVDALIHGQLSQASPYRQAQPDNLPQPLRIQLKSSDT
jgi:protein TonB